MLPHADLHIQCVCVLPEIHVHPLHLPLILLKSTKTIDVIAYLREYTIPASNTYAATNTYYMQYVCACKLTIVSGAILGPGVTLMPLKPRRCIKEH